jgi:hypothetical protein
MKNKILTWALITGLATTSVVRETQYRVEQRVGGSDSVIGTNGQDSLLLGAIRDLGVSLLDNLAKDSLSVRHDTLPLPRHPALETILGHVILIQEEMLEQQDIVANIASNQAAAAQHRKYIDNMVIENQRDLDSLLARGDVRHEVYLVMGDSVMALPDSVGLDGWWRVPGTRVGVWPRED